MIRALVLVAVLLSLSGCFTHRGSLAFGSLGYEITSIVVSKTDRKLYLMHGHDPVRTYDIELGFTPEGHKQFEADGKTPEGVYFIDRRNARSQFHRSLGISYPNARDVAFADSQGRDPGGDIFIHGTPRDQLGRPDWTAGCIAVTDGEIEEIWALVPNGTPVFIYP